MCKSKLLQAQTKNDHTAWLSSLIQGTLYASKKLGTLRIPCQHRGRECNLLLHVDRGFALQDAASGAEMWNQPYQNLASSNDDGARLLWLQFRAASAAKQPQEEEEFVLKSMNPKVVVFTLHNFLSTKLQLLGTNKNSM